MTSPVEPTRIEVRTPTPPTSPIPFLEGGDVGAQRAFVEQFVNTNPSDVAIQAAGKWRLATTEAPADDIDDDPERPLGLQDAGVQRILDPLRARDQAMRESAQRQNRAHPGANQQLIKALDQATEVELEKRRVADVDKIVAEGKRAADSFLQKNPAPTVAFTAEQAQFAAVLSEAARSWLAHDVLDLIEFSARDPKFAYVARNALRRLDAAPPAHWEKHLPTQGPSPRTRSILLLGSLPKSPFEISKARHERAQKVYKQLLVDNEVAIARYVRTGK